MDFSFLGVFALGVIAEMIANRWVRPAARRAGDRAGDRVDAWMRGRSTQPAPPAPTFHHEQRMLLDRDGRPMPVYMPVLDDPEA